MTELKQLTRPEVLALPMGPNDASAATIGDYLARLLATVWENGEGFNGKRPFGNSGWEYDLYKPLIVAGAIRGVVDPDEGWVDECDTVAGHTIIRDAIHALTEYRD